MSQYVIETRFPGNHATWRPAGDSTSNLGDVLDEWRYVRGLWSNAGWRVLELSARFDGEPKVIRSTVATGDFIGAREVG